MTTLNLDDTGTATERPGWTKQITVDRVLLLLVALFNLGTYVERQKHSTDALASQLRLVEIRLSAAEVAAEKDTESVGRTYVRRDVLEERLRSMEARLVNIESSLRILRKDP